MDPNQGNEKDPKSAKPAWWSDEQEASWARAKQDVVGEWNKVGEKMAAGGKKVKRQVSEDALAFGHEARNVYHEVERWGDDVEAKLRKEWEALGRGASQTWDRVRSAVRHGWERAKRTGAHH